MEALAKVIKAAKKEKKTRANMSLTDKLKSVFLSKLETKVASQEISNILL